MKRRTLLSLAIGSAAILGTAWSQRNPVTRSLLTRQSHPDVVLTHHSGLSQSCRLTPEQVQGPFFVPAQVRSDIREDRQGVNLELTLDVVSTTGCTPIQNALVEIWHCDAAGIYSAYPEDLARKPFETMMFLGGPDAQVAPTNEKRFLRGAQVTNANGQVTFKTIIPGWYEPRVPHIHAKVFLANKSVATTQLYLPSALTQELFQSHPSYAPHGSSPYHHGNDVVLGSNPNAHGLLLEPITELDGYKAQGLLAIA